MRRVACAAAAACLLGGATVLAFFSGGYFAQPRLVAALVTWALVLALAVTGPAPLPGGRPGRLALAGLVALTLLTAASIAWAPLRGPAVESTQRLVLYTGTLALAVAVLRAPAVRRAVEPALAAGATLVIGYGLAPRLLPDLVTLARSASAGGRLEQPLTYWNAEGALAAVGLVLCARLAGDPSRPRGLRAAAAAAVVPLGAGVYLSYSRGALAVAVLGLVLLVAAAPSRAQLAASATALATGVAAAVVASALPWVAALEGDAPRARRRDRPRAAARPRRAGGRADRSPVTRCRAAAGVGAPARPGDRGRRRGGRDRPRGRRPRGAPDAGRAGGRSGRRAAHDRQLEPLRVLAGRRAGVRRAPAGRARRRRLPRLLAAGARRSARPSRTPTRSPIEMAAELGLVGLVALASLLAGVALAARDALRRAPAAAAGPVAALVAWFLHACDRLGLADAGGDPAGDRARRHADRARRG